MSQFFLYARTTTFCLRFAYVLRHKYLNLQAVDWRSLEFLALQDMHLWQPDVQPDPTLSGAAAKADSWENRLEDLQNAARTLEPHTTWSENEVAVEVITKARQRFAPKAQPEPTM